MTMRSCSLANVALDSSSDSFATMVPAVCSFLSFMLISISSSLGDLNEGSKGELILDTKLPIVENNGFVISFFLPMVFNRKSLCNKGCIIFEIANIIAWNLL